MGLLVQAQDFTISGYVKDANNGETLIGATVLLNGTSQGVITNVYGFYSITLPSADYEVHFRYIGFETVVNKVSLTESIRLDVELPSASTKLEEIVISGEPEDVNVSGIQMSTNKLDIETITKVPAFMGESDVLRGIQMLPGVATVGEGASGFNVRGGSVGQNMILLDEAPVYNSSHLFGFFSVFNPDAVKDVNLIKGGIPARYGGRISSVLDVRMKEGNSKKISGQGGIGNVLSRFSLEGPIVKDKASFIVAGRRSYIDWLAKPFTDVFDGGAGLNFYDLTIKTNWNINKNNRIYASWYNGRDVFKFDAQQGFNWGNRTFTTRWNHIFSDRLFSNFTFFFSDYDYELAFGDTPEDKFTWNAQIKNFDFKPEFTFFINPQHELSFGGEVLYYKFEPANAIGVSAGSVIDLSIDPQHALESSLYVSNDHKVSSQLQLQYGLRLSSFALIGPGESKTFGEAPLGEEKPFIDAESFSSGEVIKRYHNFEPRLSVKYQLAPSKSIKFSYNKTNQYIHLVSNSVASSPLDIWMPSSANVEPQTGHQVAIGWFQNFGKNNNVEFSAETYYRKTENQLDYINGADLLINDKIEGSVLPGQGRAYGLELYAKKNSGKLNGWVSYTLARTEIQVDGISDDWYPTRYDQLHNVKATAFYDFSERFSISSTFTFLSGTPTTFPNGKMEVQGLTTAYINDGLRNSTRIPNYHRLDLSATINTKEKRRNGNVKKYESYWIFSLYNLYAKKNPFSIYFTQETDRVLAGEIPETQARQVSIIGAMIPSFSYNIKF